MNYYTNVSKQEQEEELCTLHMGTFKHQYLCQWEHKQQENQEAQRIAFLDFSNFLFLFFDAVICVHNAAKLQKICFLNTLIIVKE